MKIDAIKEKLQLAKMHIEQCRHLANFMVRSNYKNQTPETEDLPPDCTGDPACCPENEGHGCCKPNPITTRAAEAEGVSQRSCSGEGSEG